MILVYKQVSLSGLVTQNKHVVFILQFIARLRLISALYLIHTYF